MKWTKTKYKKGKWTKWFAWYPVVVSSKSYSDTHNRVKRVEYDWVWLELVERTFLAHPHDTFVYRDIEKE